MHTRTTPTFVALTITLATTAHSADPAWWDQRGVINANPTPDPHTVAVQGQAKTIVLYAIDELLQDHLWRIPGASAPILDLQQQQWFIDWKADTTHNLSPLQTGQLKSLAAPFYEALALAGHNPANTLTGSYLPWADAYPWTHTTNDDGDPNSPANIGQLKYAFSFDLDVDTDADGLPDWWEIAFDLDPETSNATTDSDGDGLSDLAEFTYGANPRNEDSDADGVSDSVLSGMVAHWTLDGDSSDNSPYAHHGLGATGAFVSGVSGQGYKTSASGHKIEVTSSDELSVTNGSGDFTISMWLRLDQVGLGYRAAYWKGTGNTRLPALWINHGSDKVYAQLNTTQSAFTQRASPNALQLTEWTHVVYTHTASANLLTLYIDGAGPFNQSYTGTHNTDPTGVALYLAGNSWTPTAYSIDEVRLHNRVLDPTEVTQLYNIDTDGDGLTDIQETSAGTSSLLADSDGDGESDFDELESGSDPNDVNSNVEIALGFKVYTPLR